MIQERKGDVFKLLKTQTYDGICITTNGMLRKNGNAIMGAGVAKACMMHYPMSEQLLGAKIRQNGNIVQTILTDGGKPIISFPTKNNWSDSSDIELIKKSCKELITLMDQLNLKNVLLPKPGCANGGLNWEMVRSEIEPLLDHRITIISR